jgi:L-idonate 5-dehydrogenase
MRAVVLHAEHDLRVEDRAEPRPGPGQVLVRIANGGICGSDLHYFLHGGFGVVRLREPMVLGHEIAGHVMALGADVVGPAPGTLVAVNPSTPCGHCRFCLAGQPIHCSEMRFLGSAMRMPHVQGGFADLLVCDAGNAVPMPEGVGAEKAAFAEPLAVCLHAVAQAPVYGARVLIAGAGPIGLLLVLAARYAGAREIVVTDIVDRPLKSARTVGADRTINVAADPDALSEYHADKGYFDVVFEAAGQARTIIAALPATRPRGTIVLVGQGAQADLPISAIVGKELALCGSFRFDREFTLAAELIGAGRIDVAPLLSAVMPVADANAAFLLASDKSQAIKVQLAFA